jgi:O-antigen ligase
MWSNKLLLTYIITLIGVAAFLNHFSPGSHRILIWGLGAVIAGVIFANESVRLKSIPREYLLYISLLGFALLSLYRVIDFDGFFRYYQVLIANSTLMIVAFLGIKNYADFKRTIEVLFICTSAVVLYSYFLEANNTFSAGTYQRLEGIIGNSNGTATYARTSILLGLCIMNWTKSKIKKIIILGSVLLFAYVILLTASRSNFAILLFILFVYTYIKYFKGFSLVTYSVIAVIFVAFVSSFVITYLDDFYVYERLTRNEGKSIDEIEEEEARVKLFLKAFNTTIENPINGIGLNQFRYYSGGLISHTDILDISSQLGLIAVLFYIRIYVNVWKKFWRFTKKFKDDIIVRILFLLFITEIIFGLSNPNWFLQLNMVVLSLLITYLSLYEEYDKNTILTA